MSAINELYQEVILDHNKRPRNYQTLPEANCQAKGHNPLCGDQLTLYVDVEGDVIKNVGFQGSGCAISKASASLMTDSVKGMTTAEANGLFERFHDMVTGHDVDIDELGKLAVFAGVCEFPARVKCASLAWHTLRTALEGQHGTATTE
ncbi:MAG TPA: SUF system NifU family Fe-S cluster assembly protein [Candidatus Xenobia bacterium]|jgi:nitrogen fixation NifU-like protein